VILINVLKRFLAAIIVMANQRNYKVALVWSGNPENGAQLSGMPINWSFDPASDSGHTPLAQKKRPFAA
jgi:hypothetical protein